MVLSGLEGLVCVYDTNSLAETLDIGSRAQKERYKYMNTWPTTDTNQTCYDLHQKVSNMLSQPMIHIDDGDL